VRPPAEVAAAAAAEQQQAEADDTAAAEAAAAAVAEPAAPGGEQQAGDAADAETSVEALKAQFDAATKEAAKLYRAKDHLGAAAQYTQALELCDSIPGYSSRCAALHNNRAAMYEKAGDSARCLMDCTLCLVSSAAILKHSFVCTENSCKHQRCSLMSFVEALARLMTLSRLNEPRC
jgi:hypothetical protein